jgi:hypothetical protein
LRPATRERRPSVAFTSRSFAVSLEAPLQGLSEPYSVIWLESEQGVTAQNEPADAVLVFRRGHYEKGKALLFPCWLSECGYKDLEPFFR